MIPPINVLTFFPLIGGCSEGLDAFRVFFKQQKYMNVDLTIRRVVRVLNLHRDKKIVRREPGGEMGRSLVTTGRMVMMRSIGYK